jgi:hypothetical protein
MPARLKSIRLDTKLVDEGVHALDPFQPYRL